ncbi:VWA domain-containing protein [Endozoicomonas sp. SM1973]|uniref:VWA domain-containing protein n=2 Tax=Spartinivicinus marinus TaxID=2994442 RepID=A0A853I6R8_9GAMM|nr:VWA domain-containing protein [Spartinivicinus marinus]MCX4029852.1 VWA domain-containing protein [Spartinivicinus marinus]NYZ64905.1 VWA domain-containing protein [Spartinivicinus marinus]
MMELADFHFIRPFWLLLLIPGCLLVWGLWYYQPKQGLWEQVIPTHLLKHLMVESGSAIKRWPLALLLLAWLLATLALAGPSWQKVTLPVQKSAQPLVIVLDMSLSLYADDLKPNRLTRAKRKLRDLLKQRQEGLTGLVAYAGEAYTIAPLTDDGQTIANLVKALSPEIMPVTGSRADRGINQALELLNNSEAGGGDILLMTDGIEKETLQTIKQQLKNTPYQLSILGIGTKEGAPIRVNNTLLKDQRGAIVIAKLNRSQLANLAQQFGGRYSDITLTDQDIERLLPETDDLADTMEVEQTFDEWHDQGYWLLLLVVPLALAGFRRGWLMAVLLVPLALPEPASAGWWQDLWQTRDQQGAKALANGDTASAAELFTDPSWKGTSQFQSQQYEQAAQSFAQTGNAEGFYNQGNAFAYAGKMDEAINAYEQALKLNPDFEKAQQNKKILEDLKKQQQQQQNQQQSSQNQNSPDQNDQNQSNQDSQQQDNNQQQSRAQNNDQPGKNQQDQSQSDSQSSEHPQDQQNQQAQNNQATQGSQQDQDDQVTESSSQDAEKDAKDLDEQSEKASQLSQQSADETEQQDTQQQAQQLVEGDANSLEQQQVEGWLRRIPDDPSGLLRRKLLYQQRLKQFQQQQSDSEIKW